MLLVLYHMVCSQWHFLANIGIDQGHTNITRIGYIRSDTDSPLFHLCMTAVYEAKYLASTKKAGPSCAHLLTF